MCNSTTNNIVLKDFLDRVIANFCIIQYEAEDELYSNVYILTEKYSVKQELIDNKIIKSVKPIKITQPSEIYDYLNLNVGDCGFYIVVEEKKC